MQDPYERQTETYFFSVILTEMDTNGQNRPKRTETGRNRLKWTETKGNVQKWTETDTNIQKRTKLCQV